MNYLMRFLSPSTIAILCLLFVATPVLVGCDDDEEEEESAEDQADDDDNGDEADDSAAGAADTRGPAPAAPPAELAGSFAADTDLIITASNLGDVITLPESVLESDALSSELRGQWEELLGEFREEMKADLGVDFTDASAFQEWGIDTDGQLLAGITEHDDAVFCVSLSDKSAFETFAVEVLAGEFLGVEDPEHAEDELEGQPLHSVGDDLAWTYRDDSACVAFQDSGPAGGEIIAAFIEGPDGESLADSADYQQFLETRSGGDLISFYVGGDFLMDEFFAGAGAPGMGMMVGDMFGGQAVTISLHDDAIGFRVWTGLDAERTEMVGGIITPDHEFDWSGFATEDTIAALRLSLNPGNIWEQVEAFVGQEFEAFAGEFAALVDGASAEEVFITNLSGHIGLFVYDLPEPMAFMVNEPEDLGADMESILVIPFVDGGPLAEAIDGVRPLLEADPEGGIEFGTIADDINVIDVADVEARLYHYDNVLAIATTGIDEDDAVALLKGEGSGDSLSDLGKALEEDAFTGLYLGGEIWGYIGDFIGIPSADEQFGEFILRIDADDKGVSFGTDFRPAANALYGLVQAGMTADEAGAAMLYDEVDAQRVPALEVE